MDRNQHLLEEYKSLRTEIMSHLPATTALFTINITATAAIIGYGLQSGIWGMFLIPFIYLLPSMCFISSMIYGDVRMSSYIIVNIESKLEALHWQQDWYRLRNEELVPQKRRRVFAMSSMFFVISLACLSLGMFHSGHSWRYALVVALLLLAAVGIGSLDMYRATTVETARKYIDAWRVFNQRQKTCGGEIPEL